MSIEVRQAEGSAAATTTTQPGVASTWAANTFSAFSNRQYRILWFGTILAFLAFNMAVTAQNVVAFDLTGNNRAVGFVAFGQGLAMLLLNPFGGALADRLPKRLMIILAQSIVGLVMLTMALLLVFDYISVTFLAVGAFVTGCTFAFLGPTRTALLAEVVPEERLGNAMALVQVGGNFSRICGPFLASGFLAWSFFGPTGVYFVISAMFIFVVATFYQIPPSKPPKRRETSVLQDVRLGIRHVLGNPRLFHLLASYHLVTTLGLSYYVLMPGLAKGVLNAGTAGLGVMLGVAAIGGLVMSVIVASLVDSKRAPTYLMASSGALSVSLIFLGLAPSFPLALVVMVFVGGSSSAFQTLNNAVTIRTTDRDFYGRVIGLMFLAWGILSVVALPVGFLADWLGVRTVLSSAGVILAIVVFLLFLWQQRIGASTVRTLTEVPTKHS